GPTRPCAASPGSRSSRRTPPSRAARSRSTARPWSSPSSSRGPEAPMPSHRMTSLDAAFYYLERTGQLLHVGGVYTVEGRLEFDRLLGDLHARVHLIPRYTERVVSVPFNLGHPTWEPDPHFDLRHHVLRHVLKPPGDDGQLAQLASRLFAQPLHRDRPLWELHLIEGYRGDR